MKTNKFKNLLAHTMSTSLHLAPIAAMFSLNLERGGPIGPVIAFAALMTLQSVTTLFKLIANKEIDDMPLLKYYNPHVWKSLLDNPSIRAVQKKQDAVMVKVRTGVIDDEVLSTYTDYKFNSDKIKAWKDKIYYHKTPRNYGRYPEESKWSKAIDFRFEEIVKSVEKAVSPEVLQNLIKGNHAESLSLKNFNAENTQYILQNTGYAKLKEIDYADFEQLVKEHSKNANEIISLLIKNPNAVDWNRIKSTLVHHYRRADYDSVAQMVAQIVPDTGPQILASTPSFPSFKDWGLIQEHHDYVALNRERLDATVFSQYEKDVNATAELLVGVTKTLKGMSAANAESTKKLIDDSLSELLDKSIAIRADLEASVIKDLSVHRKHLRHKA